MSQVVGILATAVKNVLFHPLSDIPGPWVFATSRFPYMYYAVSGQLAVKLLDLHKRYGAVVRTASNEVSFVQPEAWDVLYNQRDSNGYAFPKNYDTFNETRNQFTHTVFLARGEDHARMKKSLQPSFSERRVKDFEPHLLRHLDDLVECIRNDIDTAPGGLPKATDLNSWFNWFAFDIATDYTLGHSFDCVKSPEYRWWLKRLSHTWRFIVIVNNLKAIAQLLKIFDHFVPTFMLQRKVDILDPIIAQAQAQAHSRAQQQTQDTLVRPTVLSTCKVEKPGSPGLRENEIVPNASLIVAAGTDTGSTVLPGIMYLLSQNPAALKTVVDEIRGSVDGPEDITLDAINHMQYLKACIQEVMRIYTAVPEGLPRLVPDPGANVCGTWIPGGVSLPVKA